MIRGFLPLLAGLLIAAILVCNSSTVAAAIFKDVPEGHWTYDVIEEFKDARIIEGYRDHRPYVISRYEAAMISAHIIEKFENTEIKAMVGPAHKLLGIALVLEFEPELREMYKPTSDSEDTRSWLEFGEACAKLVQEAVFDLRVSAGVPRPGEKPTEIRGKGKGMFRDVPYYNWSYKAIDELRAYGLVEGYPDGLFRGRNVFTRYEMAMVVARAARRIEQMQITGEIDLKTKTLMLALMAEYEAELREMGVSLFQVDREPAWILFAVADLKGHFQA